MSQEEEEEPIGLVGFGNVQLDSDDENDQIERSIVTRTKIEGRKKENDKYKEHSYWEERFAEEEEFEWLINFNQCRNQLIPHLQYSDKILIVGCGNSTFSADLYDAGFHNIVNIDFSGVVIAKMKEINSTTRPDMQWIEMDMTSMTFDADSFDVVIDKAAMDALVVSEMDVWNPQEEVIVSVDKMCKCVDSVLKKKDGKFLQISFNQPHFRTKYLMGYRAEDRDCSNHGSHTGYSERYHWNLSFESIVLPEGGVLETFLYLMIR